MAVDFVSLNRRVLMLMTSPLQQEVRQHSSTTYVLITLQEIGVQYELYINEEETKYMKMTATLSDKLPKVTIGQYTFKNVRHWRPVE